MGNEIKKYCFDIIESINAIEDFTKDKNDYDAYVSDRKTRRAVERELEIIGEAVNRINKIYPAIEISHKRQIINMRNKVIHAYDMVDNMIIWGTIEKYLPTLKIEIQNIIASD